ncbi:ComEA family DNA-binding protein [Amphibiibacter pelophylacis]|uniref:Helix-hairpin-helix domain-containing protein n=1 Tax=Amphibiibacter pelophylacis TaxID=1799477 RepID=A0ACC6P142_9BURK
MANSALSFLRRLVLPAALVALTAGLIPSAWALDVNSATKSELDAIKGIGPKISQRIVTERKKSAFKDWADFQARVSGIGPKVAKDLQGQGLTVGGGMAMAAKPAAPAAPAAAAKPAAPAMAAKPAAPAAPAEAMKK